MRIRFCRLKQVWFIFFLICLLTGGYHMSTNICNIWICSSPDNKMKPITFAEDFLHKENLAACKHLEISDQINKYLIDSSPQLGKLADYSVVYDYIKSEKDYTGNESVTYSTHTTTDFLSHTKELSVRWDGPISIAVYVPGYDFCSAISQILYMHHCGQPVIREKVSWHIYWQNRYPPSISWWKVDHKRSHNCSKEFLHPPKSWRTLKGLEYPINVGRNVARKASKTWFVLPSDIELYPSMNLSKQFLAFISHDNFTKKSNIRKVWPRVYVVPVFEVQNNIPNTKEGLIAQLSHGKAVYFHRNICHHCQRIPGLNAWLQNIGGKNQIHAFSSVKRHFPYHRWEPIYICTNNEPFYDERLSWEGLQDKMSQMYELCLRNYNLVILDRAFLVHSPGIKKKSNIQITSQDSWRKTYITENSKIYDIIMDELRNNLGKNVRCREH